MKKTQYKAVAKAIILFQVLLFTGIVSAQETAVEQRPKSDFWNHVQIGGGLGGSFGSGYSDLTIAPGALYNFNQKFGLGVGLQYSYMKQKELYSSHLYGGSIIGLFNPIEQVQLSLEVEQLRVNLDYSDPIYQSRNFWNTGLFAGVGYRAGNVTVGLRYNLLFSEDKEVYGSALMPFIRAYF